ncbi:uncharacterized protein LOC132268728 [Cornus florida]|uniref:uncharacterized protein LOC132268728 n=1 Tax=Cornus florida TaxID=4283 RepID=UPI00289DA0BE|nr:uncharacterized protein LOC132268728 [Cornus florida]
MASYNNMQEDDYDEDDDDDSSMTRMFMSRLSIDNFDADHEELSDDHKDAGNFLSWDSQPSSVPATPRRNMNQQLLIKDYASESEAQKKKMMMRRKKKTKRMRRPSRRMVRERIRWQLDRAAACNWDNIDNTASCSSSSNRKNKKGMDDHHLHYNYIKHNYNNICMLRESEGHGGGGGGDPLMVITRPKGGRTYLCMDLEEVKACRDLGFELEHHHHQHMPTTVLTSTTLDTSSGSNSPVANWRISSPGDDPRDVKARLKLWAQAVALVSTSTPRQGC